MTPDEDHPPPVDTSALLDQLRARYRASAPELVHVFRRLAEQLAADAGAAAALDAVRQTAHRVRGTAGSYGLDQASRLAATMEERAARWQAEAALERDGRWAVVAQFADALEVAFRTE